MRSIILAMMLLAAPVAAEENIIIVLDTSGSMADYMRTAGKTRMAVAQESLVTVLSELPATTNVGILTFNGWIYKLGPVDKAKLTRAIKSTRPSGGTPLYEFTKGAADELLKARNKSQNVGHYKLLVVTDGAAGDDDLNRDERDGDGDVTRPGVLTDIIGRGITVDAIGLDMTGDHALATQINGRYVNGNDPASLTQAVRKAVAEISFDDVQGDKSNDFLKVLDKEFSDEFATAVLQGMASLENQPIGEEPPKTVIVQPDASNPVQQASIPDISDQAQSGEPAEESGFLFWAGMVVLGFFGVVFLFVIFRS